MKHVVILPLHRSLPILLALACLLGSCEEVPQTPVERRVASTQDSQMTSQDSSRTSTYSPESLTTSSAEAQRIQQDVANTLAREHGDLPEAEHTHVDHRSHIAQIDLTNGTIYTLTVLYSGPSPRRAVLAPHASQRLTLAVGAYNEAASVNAPDVLPFAGHQYYEGGTYQCDFVIETRSN